MTDATRGIVRYEPRPFEQDYEPECEMTESPSGDWVRYEDAARMAKLLARGGPGGDLGRFVPAECFAPGELVIPGWRAHELVEELDAAKVTAESLERLLERERAEHSRAMSDAAVERIRPSCSEEGGSCHAMMHSMCRRMNAMERDAARIQRARARNLVGRLRERSSRALKAHVYRRDDKTFIIALRQPRLAVWTATIADRIAAKYLKEGT